MKPLTAPDGIKYWLWVATSDLVCVLLLAPTRSSAELKQLLGEDFSGILSSDCFRPLPEIKCPALAVRLQANRLSVLGLGQYIFDRAGHFIFWNTLSAYSPQKAAAKQKCLTHLERDLKALETSRFAGNREFRARVSPILRKARTAHQDYHNGLLSLKELQQLRPTVESQLDEVLKNSPLKGWPADAMGLSNRLHRHWDEWFTFLTYPEVKPDNNDAERAKPSCRHTPLLSAVGQEVTGEHN